MTEPGGPDEPIKERERNRFAQWLIRSRRSPTSLPAELIVSETDLKQAYSIATEADIAAIEAGRKSTNICDQISASTLARLILAKSMPDDELRRYIQHLQNRYRVTVGAGAYAKYAEGIPQNMLSERSLMEAELNTLGYRLRLAYSITTIRDEHLAKIRSICTNTLAVVIAIVIMCVILQYKIGRQPFINCFIVSSLGLAGAATSVARRADKMIKADPLNDDPVVQASALQKGVDSVYIAGLCGPIFALLTLVLFLTGAFNFGNITPAFTAFTQCATSTPCKAAKFPCDDADFHVLAHCFWFASNIDAAKLGLWAFAAGFAEKFVPDVLDRFTKSAEEAKN